jgi:galactokinase
MTASTWRAPGRVTLIGDHTDYARGWVLPFAVPLATTVRVSTTSVATLRVVSNAQSEVHEVALESLAPGRRGWARYVEGAAWLLAREAAHDTARRERAPAAGLLVEVGSDLPVGAGLASSTALVCATLAALLDVLDPPVRRRWSATDIALAARRVENEYVGAPVGVMDPVVVMSAAAGHGLLLDTATMATEQLLLPLAEPGSDTSADAVAALVVDTGRAHQTGGAGYAERVAQVHEAAHALGVASLRDVADPGAVERLADPTLRSRARHVVTENARVLAVAALLREGRVGDLGPLLTASHRSLRDDFAVSTPELDLVVEQSLAAGALGARLTGAGMGGCALALVPAGAALGVRSRVLSALDEHGAARARAWFVTAAGAAGPQAPGAASAQPTDSSHE